MGVNGEVGLIIDVGDRLRLAPDRLLYRALAGLDNVVLRTLDRVLPPAPMGMCSYCSRLGHVVAECPSLPADLHRG